MPRLQDSKLQIEHHTVSLIHQLITVAQDTLRERTEKTDPSLNVMHDVVCELTEAMENDMEKEDSLENAHSISYGEALRALVERTNKRKRRVIMGDLSRAMKNVNGLVAECIRTMDADLPISSEESESETIKVEPGTHERENRKKREHQAMVGRNLNEKLKEVERLRKKLRKIKD